jgi:hypothetical protein
MSSMGNSLTKIVSSFFTTLGEMTVSLLLLTFIWWVFNKVALTISIISTKARSNVLKISVEDLRKVEELTRIKKQLNLYNLRVQRAIEREKEGKSNEEEKKLFISQLHREAFPLLKRAAQLEQELNINNIKVETF